jgi:DNA-binding MarR family transcriptional regulator
VTLNGRRARTRARITDELLDEMTGWSPGDRLRVFRSWLRGSLSLIQLNVLTVLESEGPLPMGRIAETLDVSVASATGIVDRLEERDLVERRPGSTDRRVVEVHPTAAGAAIFRDLLAERRAYLARTLERLTDRELASLLVGLRALHRAREASHAADAGASESMRSGTRAARVGRRRRPSIRPAGSAG